MAFVGLCIHDGTKPIPFKAHLINSQTKSAVNSRIRRVIKLDPYNCNFNFLISTLKEIFPVLCEENFYLTYKGEYGDKKQIFDQKDFSSVLNSMDDSNSLYILYDYEMEKYFSSENSDMPHVQFLCESCCYPLKHFRYRCQVCMDYNICWLCFQKGVHTKHRLRYVSSRGFNTKMTEIDFDTLNFKKKIGAGYYGVVQLAEVQKKISGQKSVAVKILKETATCQIQEDFKKEVQIFESVGFHENIVKLLGYCPRPMAIVMEFVSMKIEGLEINGLIMYLMFLRKKICFDNRDRLADASGINHRELESFSLQIARGMEHLEAREIVHRDLAARNVLIDSNKTLKISDFGLSRTGVYQEPNGVFAHRWAPPEVISQRIFSSKSDVWSFAVVLWEIATLGATPYDGLNFQEVEKFVTKGGRLKKPGNVTPELFNVIAKCWAQSPQKRPTFKQLVEKLNDFKWMDCSYLPFASTNCTFVLQPAMDIYETKMEELLKENVQVPSIKKNDNRLPKINGKRYRQNQRR